MRTTNNYWRINEKIPALTLRVLDSKGVQIGVISKEEALKKAKEGGEDLIEIAPNANPPVAKIIEFGKFKYQEEKKLKEAQKKSKPSELKEIRFTPFIGEGDYQTRIKRIDEFLTDKDKVKLVVYFKLNVVPEIFLTAMGAFQLITGVIGGMMFLGINKIIKKNYS